MCTQESVVWCVVLGWKLERAQRCIHFSILPAHTIESTDRMLDDLKSCIATAKVRKSSIILVLIFFVNCCCIDGPVIVRERLCCYIWDGW